MSTPVKPVKPVMVVVDDDPQVLAALRRDLRTRYRESYGIAGATSGEEAISTLRELKARGETLAIVISDQRMPGIQGTEVLAQSLEIYPLARRVLLTAYSDVDAAVRAINVAHHQSLSLEAVGSTRGVPVSGDRRAARCLAT